MKKFSLLAAVLCMAFFLNAQTPIGTWKTIDDETGEAKSHIELYMENGKMYGKVRKLLRKNVDPSRVCDKCTDWRKGQKILEMMVVRDMVQKGDTWKSGKILDPEKGKEYSCTMWFDGGKSDEIKVRGWLGPFYRTQTWYRVP